MKIKLTINYYAAWGQTLHVYGSNPELGGWNESRALEMKCIAPSQWMIEFELKKDVPVVEYKYFIKEYGTIIRQEWGTPHTLKPDSKKHFYVEDVWQEQPQQKFLYTSGFTEGFFYHKNEEEQIKYLKNTILLQVYCPYVNKNQELILCGSSKYLGLWKIEDALKFQPTEFGKWQISLSAVQIKSSQQFKLAIFDKIENKVIHWEEGWNRSLDPVKLNKNEDSVIVENFIYRYSWMNWKAAGVAIPVFSLRSEDSYGVGEFPDLKKMVDWASITGQKVIQILPINDTTITYTWTDSYPYNAISIYALHPIYLGLKQHPLKDKKKLAKYEKEATALNALAEVDYDKVIALKYDYAKDLFAECGEATLKSKDFAEFFKQNEEWLFPYACFSYLRDLYQTADYSLWKTHSKFSKNNLKKFVESDLAAKKCVEIFLFVQYLLHKQLLDVKEYAHEKGVILKGDIPIGISRNSVEAWVEPHLFNLDTQTGAPPDDFSINGQNWGFPTYNWHEMSKDGYQWWIKRFRKMADYFDTYRIDHILGFFRIWEIPLSSVQGLLGYFSPALPLTVEEINWAGMWFDDYRMTNPYIHEHFLNEIFGEYTQEVIDNYLNVIAWQRFELKDICNTQVKIKKLFAVQTDEKANHIRDGLYALCNEVLFIRDKRDPNRLHPRITAQYTYSYKDLDATAKAAFNRIYDDFFYRRHSQFWRDEAMKKLPVLISSTSMLVCGEDLGMIPECVPSVMNELQILSLEIERMPKSNEQVFVNLPSIPYYSVCTTSTHDMAPLRVWWTENRDLTQKYYNEILWKQGAAPTECTTDICWQILMNHLNSPAMLAILPLQDWLSMDSGLRRTNAYEERINIPAIAQHYWRYRMHITLEQLIQSDGINKRIKSMLESSGRM